MLFSAQNNWIQLYPTLPAVKKMQFNFCASKRSKILMWFLILQFVVLATVMFQVLNPLNLDQTDEPSRVLHMTKELLIQAWRVLNTTKELVIQASSVLNMTKELDKASRDLNKIKVCPPVMVLEKSSGNSLPRLPDLQFYMNALSLKSPRRHDSFDPRLNAKELMAITNLLWAFLDLCEQHRISAIMVFGTLLGSYRHHGFVPWDDDVDIWVDTSGMDLLLNNNSKGMQITKAGCWRVWNKTTCYTKIQQKKQHWCWPFLDVYSYQVNGDLLKDMDGNKLPVNLTFPLHKRPFMGRWVNSPKDSLRELNYNYKPNDICSSTSFLHKSYSGSQVQYAKCSNLSSTYPFVTRTPDPDTVGKRNTRVLETLRNLDGCPLYTVPVDEPVVNIDYSIVVNMTK